MLISGVKAKCLPEVVELGRQVHIADDFSEVTLLLEIRRRFSPLHTPEGSN